jgi:hypothetical protein
MTFAELKAICRPTMENGPTRIVINEHGEAVAPSRTTFPPDVIFVRHDGWSLGAPESLVATAERIWADCWVGVLMAGEPMPVTYEAWKAVNHPS